VTGPDEYTTVVNNNAYTNLMARENLWYAAATVRRMRERHPEHYATLVHRTALEETEAERWQQAADNMYVPFDGATGIVPQDDSFLDREVWDLKNTPRDRFPLLLYHHPLVIYRHQVIKQADVVLALFLLGQEFSAEEKKRNFDYYDPLTTGDSSLSACIQSIVANEIGDTAKALKYARYALLMDLADVGGNVKDGCHIASMGGTWMVIVYGFAGMRDYGGRLSFTPRLPRQLRRLGFSLRLRENLLAVDLEQDAATYTLREGSELTVVHQGEELRLTAGAAVRRPVAAPPRP
jgi:alpha,alpha-trehalose phosphorylase